MIEKIETIEMNIGLHLEITDCKNKSVIVLRNDQNYKMQFGFIRICSDIEFEEKTR